MYTLVIQPNYFCTKSNNLKWIVFSDSNLKSNDVGRIDFENDRAAADPVFVPFGHRPELRPTTNLGRDVVKVFRLKMVKRNYEIFKKFNKNE